MMLITDGKIIEYRLDGFVMIRISAMVKTVLLCLTQMFTINNIDEKNN